MAGRPPGDRCSPKSAHPCNSYDSQRFTYHMQHATELPASQIVAYSPYIDSTDSKIRQQTHEMSARGLMFISGGYPTVKTQEMSRTEFGV